MEKPTVDFGQETCGDERVAFEREWLATNGIGGFASGTIGDCLTRRYHGLLFAALQPPLGRTLLLAKLDATATYGGRAYPLCTNLWKDGTLDPHGYRYVERFRLEGSVPTWTYAFSDAVLERSIWMEQGENTTYVRYELLRASEPVTLSLAALADARDYHTLTHAYAVTPACERAQGGVRFALTPHAPPLFIAVDRGEVRAGSGWYYGFSLAAERDRGLDDLEDLYEAATCTATLAQGETLTIAASAGPLRNWDAAAARQRRAARDAATVKGWRGVRPADAPAPAWLEQLALAADQFVVERSVAGDAGHTVIAGYPWFGDWGRDTMISLPGLTLATGRPAVARDVLLTFARFLSEGMLPNRFPDSGVAPEYNTVDATLWYVEAIRRYVDATQDDDTAERLFPALEAIVAAHVRGTRYGIHVDETDGLLYAGQDGVQLTWMDAKVDGRVVTPRIGKPVEINALWYNALRTVEELARRLGRPAAFYADYATRARDAFGAFWNDGAAYCYDVIGGPRGNDPAIRPNAVIAAAVHETPLSPAQRRSIVDVAGRELLASYGLRTLSQNDPAYRGTYRGGPSDRDAAYHQGTVWPWLLGQFVTAHVSAYGDRARALAYLSAIPHLLGAYGAGSLPEIADGDAPYRPRGCIAQAWSVAEILRAYHDATR